MILDKSNKSIFVHIPKTAGISITACLKHYTNTTKIVVSKYNKLNMSEIKYKALTDVFSENIDFSGTMQFTEHSGVNDIIHGAIEEVKDISEYFVYTSVRNPWAQTVSMFNYFKLFDVPGFENVDFDYYCDLMSDNEVPFPHYYGFIYDSDGNLRVDEILYLEDINNEWEQKIHSKIPSYPKKINARLNHTQKSDSDYRDIISEKNAAKIADYRSKDLSIFEYSFDAGPDQKPTNVVPNKIDMDHKIGLNWVTSGRNLNTNEALAHGIVDTKKVSEISSKPL